jgi:hypothetical protein
VKSICHPMKVYSQAMTEKTDRDLTKPQKEIFYRRQEDGYGKIPPLPLPSPFLLI